MFDYRSLVDEAKKLGVGISPAVLDKFRLYCREIIKFNETVNLSGLKTEPEILKYHFLDSLSIFILRENFKGREIADIGTGAGFPGLPIALVDNEVRMFLIESRQKKINFLFHLVKELDLASRVVIIDERIEKVGQTPEYRNRFDFVLSRALDKLSVVVEYALPLLKEKGKCIAMKGEVDQEINHAQRALEIIGGAIERVEPVSLDGIFKNRNIVVIEKVKPTPDRFPRRSGIPAKRPIM